MPRSVRAVAFGASVTLLCGSRPHPFSGHWRADANDCESVENEGKQLRLFSLTTKLLRIISALVEKHRIHVRKRWFGPLPMTTWVALLTATFVCIAAAGNIWVRFQQLEIWQASPTATELYGAPLFSTADAPYFMLQARSIQAEQGCWLTRNAFATFQI